LSEFLEYREERKIQGTDPVNGLGSERTDGLEIQDLEGEINTQQL